MTDTATDLTPQAETPPDVTPQAQGDGDPAPLQIEDDAAVDAALTQSAIDIPDGDKLVAMSDVGKVARAYREKLKDVKAELDSAKTTAARSTELEQQIASLTAKVQELTPYVSAYQAMTQAAQQAAPNAEEDAEAEEIARDLDLYTTEGKPDVTRAKRIMAREQKRAERIAEARIAPVYQQTAQTQSASNLAKAKATVLPNGQAADPAVLDMVWRQLDSSVTSTPEGAMHAFVMALGRTVALKTGTTPAPARTPSGQFAAQAATEIPPPMFTEKAGGRDTPNSVPFSPHELKYMKDNGISEKDYTANLPPWLKQTR